MKIKFGTSGWRGIIADDFTFENVKFAVYGIVKYLKEIEGKSVIVGYDTRFLSEDFAKSAAEIIAYNGIKVLYSQDDIPTPVVSYEVITKKLDGGLNFTASHNDYMYNGLKFSNKIGEPALPEETQKIEKYIDEAFSKNTKINSLKFDEALDSHLIEILTKTDYISDLKKLIDVDKIKAKNLKVVYEPFFGTGRRFVPELLSNITDFTMIHGIRDPFFGKIHPEPIEANLKELSEEVLNVKADIGIATDGDADRFGFIDKDGSFIPPNIILSIIYYYLLKVRGMQGNVVRTVSTTSLLDRIARKNGFDAIVTPVGFKYIGEALYEGKAIFGGEESGGASLKGWLTEKDGILINGLVLEIVSHFGKTLKELQNDLFREFGEVDNNRIDIAFDESLKEKANNLLKDYIVKNKDFLDYKEIDETDGIKISFKDESGILFRFSGTEPKLRIYCESDSLEKLYNLNNLANKIFNLAMEGTW